MRLGSARLWRTSLDIASSPSFFLNQNARGLGRFGRSGIMKNPAKPHTTVMIALITNSHLMISLAIFSKPVNAEFLPPSSEPAMAVESSLNRGLESTRHHPANRLATVIETHAFR